MSGIGHLAIGLAAKPLEPKIPLWVYLVASETNDLLYFVFTAVGLESKVSTSISFSQGIQYLNPSVNPWSHGFIMSTLWAILAGSLTYAYYRDRRASLLMGGVVFSHWLLDLLMHSNLPLFFEGSPLVGLGLENTGTGFLLITIIDLILVAAGLYVYFRYLRSEKLRKMP